MIGWEAYSPRIAVEWAADRHPSRHRQVACGIVFLDISGFTALSEMLAGLGRVGAEQITDVIAETFDRLLVPAYTRGGSMLKFGGDALLLMFDGEGGGSRAAQAASEMMALLDAGNPVRTRAGDIDLGMTVGVHEGLLDLVLPHGRRRELIVCGPALSQTLAVEADAERGQVLVSQALADRLPATALGRQVGCGVQLIGDVPDGGTGVAQGPKASTPEAQQLIDPAIVAHLGSGGGHGEHRTVTVGFLHFDGTDALMSANPDHAVDALQTLLDVVIEACAQTEVTLLSSDADIDGGKLIMVAGAPTSHGDDTDRLLWAARRILDADSPLDPRIGVARGPVFAGPIGPFYRRTYTILGDTVNLAARVMAQAQPGELRCTVGAANAARTLFELRSRDEFMAKGKSQPVHTLTLGAEAGIRLRMRPDDHWFVGRADEMALLTAATEGLARGWGAVALLTGPAGSGKSRLVDELQDRNVHLPFFLAACQETAQHRPFYAAVQCLRMVVGRDRRASASLVLEAARGLLADDVQFTTDDLPLLGPLLGEDLPDTDATRDLAAGHRRDRTARLVVRLMELACPDEAVLVIEDGQWGDAESRLMLQALVDRLSTLPWLVLVTARSPDSLPRWEMPPAVEVTKVELGPLSAAESRRLLLQDVEAGRIGLDRVDEMVRRAAGNPLFLGELAAAGFAGAEGGDIGDGIESVLQSRLDQLPAADRQLLGQAAVLGVEFTPELLVTVAGEDAISSETLDRLRGFLRPMRSGTVRFNQTLYQEVAYGAIPYRVREELHARAARAIAALPESDEQPDAAETLSRHWFLAGDMPRAWRASRAAARLAAEQDAPSSSAMLYRRAITAAQSLDIPVDTLAAVHGALGDALLLAGNYDESVSAYMQAIRLDPPGGVGVLHMRLTKVHERLGAYPDALAALDAASSDPFVDGDALQVERALVLNRMGRHDAAIDAASHAVAAQDDGIRGRALYALAWALNSTGEDGAEPLARDAAALLEQQGDFNEAAKAQTTLGWALYRAGDWSGSVAANELGAHHFSKVGDIVNRAITEMNMAEIRSDQGRLDEARELLEQARMVLAAAHHEAAVAFADLLGGRLAARSGDPGLAQQLLNRSLQRYRAIDLDVMVPTIRGYLAESALFAADPATAKHDLLQLRETGDAGSAALRERLIGVADWRLGSLEAARRRLDRAAESIGAEAGPYEQLLLHVTRMALGMGSGTVPAGAANLDVVDPLVLSVGPVLAADLR